MTGLLVLALPVVAATVTALAWARGNLVAVTVVGHSMIPAHQPGDRVLVRRVRPDRLRRFDVVVADVPRSAREGTALGRGRFAQRDDHGAVETWQLVTQPADGTTSNRVIKRIAAVAGDPLPARVPRQGDAGTVADGHLVLLSDNPGNSVDSRHFGCVPVENVVGRVIGTISTGARRDR